VKSTIEKLLNAKLSQILLLAAFCAAIGASGFALVSYGTSRLLEADAKMEAEKWSAYLAAQINKAPIVASTGQLSDGLAAAIEQARTVGGVYDLRIFDANGHPLFASTVPQNRQASGPSLVKSRPEIAKHFAKGVAHVVTSKGVIIGDPEFTVHAVVPVVAKGKIATWLEIHLDQTARQALYFRAALRISLAVGLIMAIGPVLGFWYRTRQKQFAERQLSYFTSHDPGTGLLNAASWTDALAGELEALIASNKTPALLHINFEDIGLAASLHGPQAADHLMSVSAHRIADRIGLNTLMAKLNGTMFSVLVKDVADPMEAATIARSLIDDLALPVDWCGNSLVARLSVGIAMAPHDGDTGAKLSRAAGLALKDAREKGHNKYCFFNSEHEAHNEQERNLERIVLNAADQNALEVHYQPIVDLNSNKITGFEALLRLKSAELGSIPPSTFIPIAERTNVIDRIGLWCIEEACRTAATWPQDFVVSINLSPLQFNSGTLLPQLRRILDKTRFPAYRLEFEITEGILMDDDELVQTQLGALRDMGVKIAIDDFGTGYSSLNYLWRFPFSKLKIDRSFINAMMDSPSMAGLLRAIIAMGRSMGLPITAEGVETAAQAQFLKKLHCDLVQGYFYSKPVPATELAALIMRDFSASTSAKPASDVPANPAQVPAGALA
jgi:diguanylate cyclase (GGDEF)-like protein